MIRKEEHASLLHWILARILTLLIGSTGFIVGCIWLWYVILNVRVMHGMSASIKQGWH